MKKYLFFFIILLFAASCQESLEQRAYRVLKEYSDRNCPLTLSETITMDSCLFETGSHTLHYFYTLSGTMDNDSALNKEAMRELLAGSLKNETNVRIFKEADYNFSYTYYSQSQPGKMIFETTFTKEDYE